MLAVGSRPLTVLSCRPRRRRSRPSVRSLVGYFMPSQGCQLPSPARRWVRSKMFACSRVTPAPARALISGCFSALHMLPTDVVFRQGYMYSYTLPFSYAGRFLKPSYARGNGHAYTGKCCTRTRTCCHFSMVSQFYFPPPLTD